MIDPRKLQSRSASRGNGRRGFLTVLSAFLLVVMLGFVSLGVDTALMVQTHASMQSACDAAALAAAQEINVAVAESGDDGEAADLDANSIAVEAAREMAADVAARNGVYVDPDVDVTFGKRSYNAGTGEWPIQWGVEPFNVVRVEARRDQQDLSLPDGRLPLAFGWAVGMPSAEVVASASAFVEARDLVMVLDFSGSMNDDSELKSIDDLGREAVESNLYDIFQALGPPDVGTLPFEPEYVRMAGDPPSDSSQPQIHVTFKNDEVYVESTLDLDEVTIRFTNYYTQTFSGLSGNTGTFSGTGWLSGRTISTCWVESGNNGSSGERFDDTVSAIVQAYGLDSIAYPYSSGSWEDFIEYCRYDWAPYDAGYNRMYGSLLWMNYLLDEKPTHANTADLWKTPHYPFHAMKNGATLFCNFLGDLDFGDELGLVVYATTARVESSLNLDGAYVDLGSDLITANYSDIDTIQRHKQAGHYDRTTAMGDGIEEATQLLEGHARYGSRPTMFVMTDGQTNVGPYSFSMPSGFDWDDWTDYDGDGTADYSTSNSYKKYAFYQAMQAAEQGITIHTMSVGAGADDDLMKAIAFVGEGTWLDVPGGTTVAEMEEQILTAFGKIAAKIPPPKLVYDDGTE